MERLRKIHNMIKCFQSYKFLFLASFIILINCNSNREQSPIVAQVGTEVLTLDKVLNSYPPEFNITITEAQIRDYIQRWIDTQVLYQGALQQKVHQFPQVEERLKEIQKEIVVAMFLDMKVNKNIEVSESEIKAYYNEHQEEFIRPEETRHLWIMLIEEWRETNNIRRQLLRGEDAGVLAREHSHDPSSQNGGDLGFVVRSRLPKELGDVAFTLATERLSTPIKTNLGYYLVNVFEVRKKDEIQLFDEVYNLIRERLIVQKRNENYDQLLALLKESAHIQKRFDVLSRIIPQAKDSVSMKNESIDSQ